MTLTRRPPWTSTRCIILLPWVPSCHFTLLVTYQTPSGTPGKEKLPDRSAPCAQGRDVERVVALELHRTQAGGARASLELPKIAVMRARA